DGLGLYHATVIDSQRMLLQANFFNSFILSSNGELSHVGGSPSGQGAPIEGRYYLFFDSSVTPCRARLWDILEQVVIFDNGAQCDMFRWTDGGITIVGGGTYSFETGNVYNIFPQIPINVETHGLEVVLYSSRHYSETLGIYRFMPPGINQLLIEGAQPISLPNT
ncbi:MAG: hypothetical protein AAF653_11095, partial [Chloroflexota bacterium]